MGIPLLVIATVMTFGPYYEPKPQPGELLGARCNP